MLVLIVRYKVLLNSVRVDIQFVVYESKQLVLLDLKLPNHFHLKRTRHFCHLSVQFANSLLHSVHEILLLLFSKIFVPKLRNS